MKKKTSDDSAFHTGDETDQCEHVGFRYKKSSVKIHILQTGENEWCISCRIATNNSGYGFGMSKKTHVYLSRDAAFFAAVQVVKEYIRGELSYSNTDEKIDHCRKILAWVDAQYQMVLL